MTREAALLPARLLCWLTVLCALVPALPAVASTLPELREAVDACGRISADERRLACFDALVQEQEPHEARFGRETVRSPQPAPQTDEDEPSGIEAVLVRLDQLPRGERVFYLDNGQVWAETSPGRSRYRADMTVRVERTPMGGYILSTDRGRATRVRRLE